MSSINCTDGLIVFNYIIHDGKMQSFHGKDFTVKNKKISHAK